VTPLPPANQKRRSRRARAGVLASLGVALFGGVACLPPELHLAGAGGFAYSTSNFDAADRGLHPESAGAVVLDCGGVITFDSATATFDRGCDDAGVASIVPRLDTSQSFYVLPMLGLLIARGTTLRLVGPKAVVLAVFGDATISGAIDASASGDVPGAGGNTDCGTSSGQNDPTALAEQCQPGGGGGGHRTDGAPGGASDFSAGMAQIIFSPTDLVAGCPGGAAGSGHLGGGAGGGAVQISASGRLSIDGEIRASGGDGTARAGGGSGGTIVLEADSVELRETSRVIADGGDGSPPSGVDAGSSGRGGTRELLPTTGAATCASMRVAGGGGAATGRVVILSHGDCTQSGLVSPGIECGGSCGCPVQAPCSGRLCCRPLTCAELESVRPPACGTVDDGCGGTVTCDPC
jgi:hypothetical protein